MLTPNDNAKHELNNQQDDAKLSTLQAAIDEGDASGVAEGNPFDRIRATIKSRQPGES
ncbi:MAG: hypothetical protein K2Q23_13505 [Bryobacteraceae bacterium]|nr:hypothetical protein [Bryobacteraceae bacterium]